MRLTPETIGQLPNEIARFDYDRDEQAVGMVHFGIGAFHRGHQAWYTHRAMNGGDRDWATTGVSFRSRDAAVQINPQAGLFSVAERSQTGVAYEVIGSLRSVLPPSRVRRQVPQLIASLTTRIISLTITEKGYCRDADGSLDRSSAMHATSIYPVLSEGLRRRRDAGRGGLSVLSCDNLAANGTQLARLLREYCEDSDPSLGRWIETECTFPNTMVDRIVPATTIADISQIQSDLGVCDAAAVVTEPFSQWVIEDCFAAGRPAWDKVGAQLVSDVAPYEAAKLRMLNGAHSALAYLGLAAGHTYVHEAVADTVIREVVEQLMRGEGGASLAPASGQNLEAYADALLVRFGNPALHHRLRQIAADGSQKLRQRWLDTLAFHQRRARHCPAILKALAAWLRHVRGDNGPVDDPRAEELRTAWGTCGIDGIVQRVFGAGGLIASEWTPTALDKEAICRYLRNT